VRRAIDQVPVTSHVGVIATQMDRHVFASEFGPHIQSMVKDSGEGRVATTADMAGVIAILAGRDLSMDTGSDVVVDGGGVAS
jgi:NAD(P)-dependent dehydrogenase (short-subunit alcohol dehydrogenase family)